MTNVPDSIEDTGWVMNEFTSNARRGIRDYDRRVKFKTPLTPDELETVRVWLRDNECPGWTGVTVRTLGDCNYLFRTTYDSSD